VFVVDDDVSVRESSERLLHRALDIEVPALAAQFHEARTDAVEA
jgi:FixJ family two-component response regulator